MATSGPYPTRLHLAQRHTTFSTNFSRLSKMIASCQLFLPFTSQVQSNIASSEIANRSDRSEQTTGKSVPRKSKNIHTAKLPRSTQLLIPPAASKTPRQQMQTSVDSTALHPYSSYCSDLGLDSAGTLCSYAAIKRLDCASSSLFSPKLRTRCEASSTTLSTIPLKPNPCKLHSTAAALASATS